MLGKSSEEFPMDIDAKAAAVRASPSVVAVTTSNIPDDMILYCGQLIEKRDDVKYVFPGTGLIIECNDGDGGSEGRFVSTILAPATLFVRSNGVKPEKIEVDVYESGGKLFKGEVLACDFHYNLAAIRILSDSPLQTAILRSLDDVSSIDLTEHHQLCEENPFQLRPHSNLFKILPGTRIIILGRSRVPPFGLQISSGVLGSRVSSRFDCELLGVEDHNYEGNEGPAINFAGEFIGFVFNDSRFLPSNLLSRWWNHYKSCEEFCQPWLGVEISNLLEADAGFLEQFVRQFPNITTGVLVTKVKDESPAHLAGLEPDDVIVKCDGKLVRSKLEFFEKIWDNGGKHVELNVVRASNGDQWSANMTIGKIAPENFYRWRLPSWVEI